MLLVFRKRFFTRRSPIFCLAGLRASRELRILISRLGDRMKQPLGAFASTERHANILCIDQFSNFGGGQRSLLDLLPAFSERGWNSSVAIPGEGPFTSMIQRRGYRTHNFACGTYASRKKPM